MKRLATKLVLFLLLGAIVNVAVAWGCRFVEPNWAGGRSALGFGIRREWLKAPLVGLPSYAFRWSRYDNSPGELIWSGFAINTIFYAAALWFIFAIPATVKRLRRRRRGQCIHCGYDLRGQPTGSAKCPECGLMQ
jgi:hypothetical protein